MNESVAGRSERDELSPLRPRWEWSADEIKRIGYRVVGMIAEHLTTLPDKKMEYLPTRGHSQRRHRQYGPINPLDEIADICEHHKLWLHVDGAYGALAILDRQYEKQLSALPRADSIALDPNKWLYVPVEAGVVLVRDGSAYACDIQSQFRHIFQTDGKTDGVGGSPWFSEYGFTQTRGFRALKVWMVWLGVPSAPIETNIMRASGINRAFMRARFMSAGPVIAASIAAGMSLESEGNAQPASGAFAIAVPASAGRNRR